MRLYGPSGDSVCFVVEPEGGAFTANRSQLPGTSLPPVASCSRPAQTSTVIGGGEGGEGGSGEGSEMLKQSALRTTQSRTCADPPATDPAFAAARKAHSVPT